MRGWHGWNGTSAEGPNHLPIRHVSRGQCHSSACHCPKAWLIETYKCKWHHNSRGPEVGMLRRWGVKNPKKLFHMPYIDHRSYGSYYNFPWVLTDDVVQICVDPNLPKPCCHNRETLEQHIPKLANSWKEQIMGEKLRRGMLFLLFITGRLYVAFSMRK